MRWSDLASVGGALAAPAVVFAGGGSAIWTFDETTTGQDVFWTSATSIDPVAALYESQFQITLVEVDVTWLGFPFNNIDVTGQVPPELLGGTVFNTGPAPAVFFNNPLEYPAPPAPPCLSALLTIELDAGGFAHLLGTNIVLGDCDVDLGFGIVTVQLQSVRLTGQITVNALNCPWDLDAGGDTGVTDLLALLAAWGTPSLGPPDFDGDGFVGVTDLLALLGAWGVCPK